ncbi:glycoside hydrolase 5 family protein [Botryobacter ruber]|uniref:cellulase family glycosylhydrolase n=1 Tax=Botryobacter ruber TaxID=2171629 RepID=UPI000E0C52B4|nr:cellulase family glycosylhydrolase [Botryobacter ruber]
MKKHVKILVPLLLFTLLFGPALQAQQRWTVQKANAWYAKQPWLAGCNYLPQNAINQLEMWQAETFDPKTIDMELGWAAQLGFNTMRVYLQDQLWVQDAAGFKKRMDQFLDICARHNIKPMFVLFDSCWDPFPRLGKQRAPIQGLHNSGWVQSPGAEILLDPTRYPVLERYVKDIVGHFKNDDRILAWDVWNEPDNTNDSSYGKFEPKNKVDLVLKLLPQVFDWARAAQPTQPLTSGIWRGDWSSWEKLGAMEKVQLENSDVISFHNYDGAEEFEKRVKWLLPYNRPLLCTEYMSRGNNSTFQGSMPVAKKYKVAAFNWGFVAGKSNTIYPWDSWSSAYASEPKLWFHDILRANGQPYRQEEVNLIKQLTAQDQNRSAAGKKAKVN